MSPDPSRRLRNVKHGGKSRHRLLKVQKYVGFTARLGAFICRELVGHYLENCLTQRHDFLFLSRGKQGFSMNLRPAKMMRSAIQWLIGTYPEVAFSIFPPYLGAGVQVEHISDDFRKIEVCMPLRWYNRNYVGTQFGGSLYSMCDPFYMVMLMQNLGDDYIVWDKSAEVRFRKPGTGTVRAEFELTADEISDIRRRVDDEGVVEPEFTVEVTDDAGELVAEVDKRLHIRRKD